MNSPRDEVSAFTDDVSARPHMQRAREHSGMGTVIQPGARLAALRRILILAAKPFTSYQVVYNNEMVEAVEALNDQVEVLTTRATDALSRLARSEEMLARIRSDLSQHTSRLDLVLRAAQEALPDTMDERQLATLRAEFDQRYAELYRDLEATFRGTREYVRGSVEGYMKDIAAAAGSAPVVDMGSGRGEFLEACREHGLIAYGIETNPVFVRESAARGLEVREMDVLAHLAEVPDGSLGAITLFHVAEHLPLDSLVELIDAALRALQPGGMLLLETPNPTNVRVGAASFYLDPTHLKPLHPRFLDFLCVQRGFAATEVRFLHGETTDGLTIPDADPHALDELNWALFSPFDYAVLARKAPSPRP